MHLRSSPRRVSRHCQDQRKQLWVVYLDFANAFNSVDHEALWRWLRELNVPDVDLLPVRSLYDQSYYVADLPYGQSAPIPLTRGTKQGDKLSPLLFGLIFNCLLLVLGGRKRLFATHWCSHRARTAENGKNML